MPSNKKPRKAYRPKVVYANASHRAMNAVTLLTPEEREHCCAAPEHAQLEFEAGRDQADHWATMADALNVAEALSEIGICSDLASRDLILAGQKTLADLHSKIPCTLTPCDTLALSDAIEMHRIQLSLCDYSEYRRAIEVVKRKTRGALSGSSGPGVTLIGGLVEK